MYGWIWRHLPFGLPGRIAGMLVLAAGAAALLWFVVFPAVDPLLPFNDVQVTGPAQPTPSPSPAPHPPVGLPK